jgi:hypothetical protein
VLWRLAARFVTGPIAFLIAGLIDIGMLLVLAALAAIRARVRPPGSMQRLSG